jgi:hypothetical protein
MPEICSCGAQLPPDALFCHKCGKPQREFGAVEPEERPVVEVAPPPIIPVRREAPPLSFRNPIALRIALIVALGATFLSFLPLVNWLAGGFFSVFLYRRRTGSLMNVGAGMRLGWITGVLTFVPASILFAIQALPHFGTTIQERMQSMSGQDPAMVQEMVRFLQSGPGMAAAVAFFLVFMFLVITVLSMAGGALAAKVGSRP